MDNGPKAVDSTIMHALLSSLYYRVAANINSPPPQNKLSMTEKK